MEKLIAGRIRHWSIPSDLHHRKNPVPLTPDVIAESRAHFADHCAQCHGNDGKGKTDMGQHLYPRAPDLTLPETQALSDGEIFATIENGVRLTGMPGFGNVGGGKLDARSLHPPPSEGHAGGNRRDGEAQSEVPRRMAADAAGSSISRRRRRVVYAGSLNHAFPSPLKGQQHHEEIRRSLSLLLLAVTSAHAHAGHIHTYMGSVTMLHGDNAFMMKTTDGKDLTI